MCVLISFAAVGGHTVQIRTVCTARSEGTIFEAACWHENRGCLQCFFLLLGRTVKVVQQTVGMFF
jgi:hypothetical protein